jgi:hypothetical protein
MKTQPTPPPEVLGSPSSSASLVERQEQEPKYEMPTWGNSISAAELITIMLQREGTRDDALDTLAQTLADLGISGEEIAHWQKMPGICHDCAETDDRLRREWSVKAKQFPTTPIEMHRGYLKSDGQNAGADLPPPATPDLKESHPGG